MREPKFWDDAALEACGAIFSRVRPNTVTPPKIRADLDSFIDTCFEQSQDKFKQIAEDYWRIVGSDAIAVNEGRVDREEALPILINEVAALLVKKQRDYGHENIRRFGRHGLMIRCHDKIARLENLCGADFEPNNESIDDTIIDIIGYSAIGIMWEREEFMLPLAPPEKV